MDFYSHIEKENNEITFKRFLKGHLKDVADAIEGDTAGVYDDALLSKVGYLIGIGHDFGKYTTFFQKYLLTGENQSNLQRHGFISAVFTAYEIMRSIDLNKGRYTMYLPLIAYFDVLHHHGDLNSFKDDIIDSQSLEDEDFIYVDERMRDKLIIMKEQIQDILKNKDDIQKEYDILYAGIDIGGFYSDWLKVLYEIDREKYKLSMEDKDLKSYIFSLLLFYYSALIDSDKRNAAGVKYIERKKIPQDIVDNFRKSRFNINSKEGIFGLRNEIYNKIVDKIQKVNLDNHIFTLTAPTGTGKTLASFSAAVKLRHRIENERGITPRIIYSLPFTSIIDQNYDVVDEVLSQIDDFSRDKSAYLIKHHHLSDVKYKYENEDRPVDESLMLVESWDSEVIVTTFVQLLHTLFGYKNRFLKKFHNIANSIILLDEVQNIDVKYWPAINAIFNIITKELHCYIILLTATKPLIFDEGDAIELLDDNEKYFKSLNRVKLITDLKSKSLDELVDIFVNNYDEGKSYLVILNTIKSSLNFYDRLKSKLNIKNTDLYYLSTNIIPKERLNRINKIRNEIKEGKKIIVVSTQVVEAGVDLDVDIVIRDLAPIDSIVQASGRCNRRNLKGIGSVYVYNLSDKRSYSSMVYGAVSIDCAKNVLRDEIEEESFYDMINQYFEIVKQKKDLSISSGLIEAIDNFCFDGGENVNSISKFHLIDKRAQYVDVFIQVDKDAILTWEKYEQGILHEKDFKKRQENYLNIRRDLKSYIISVPLKLAKNMIIPTKNSSLFLLPYENLNDYYSLDTGFNRNIDDDTILFF